MEFRRRFARQWSDAKPLVYAGRNVYPQPDRQRRYAGFGPRHHDRHGDQYASGADGDALSFNWTFGDGGVGLNAGPNPTHIYALAGTFTVTLTANDGETNSAPATTTVTVLNRPPIANAGPDQTVRQHTVASLNGSASSDPDGSITQFAWRQVSGTAVTLSGANTVAPQFTAPSVRGSTPLQLVFELTVTDDDGATATDQVVITVDK